MPTGPAPKRVLPVTTGHKLPQGPTPSVHRLAQRVTHARRAPTPARFARLNTLHLPTGPTPQRVLSVTTDHKRPQGLSPNAFRLSQRVTNVHGAVAPAHSARLNGSHTPTGPQPQKVPPVLTGQICPRGLSPKAFRSAQSHKMPTGPSPQWNPPVTTGHTCPRGPSSSAFHPSQRTTDAHGALAPACRLAVGGRYLCTDMVGRGPTAAVKQPHRSWDNVGRGAIIHTSTDPQPPAAQRHGARRPGLCRTSRARGPRPALPCVHVGRPLGARAPARGPARGVGARRAPTAPSPRPPEAPKLDRCIDSSHPRSRESMHRRDRPIRRTAYARGPPPTYEITPSPKEEAPARPLEPTTRQRPRDCCCAASASGTI